MQWTVILSSKATEGIHDYIELYQGYFLDMYVDTGIWSEHIIRENCIRTARDLRDSLRTAIDARMIQEIIPYQYVG